MLAGALLLTTMIVWMLRERASVRANLEAQVERHVSNAQRLGLFLLIVTAVLREGIETTIFLNAARYALDNGVGLFGALVGLAVALVMGVLLFAGIRRVNLRRFFTATSVLLILFAAGLVSHGFHELSEAGVVEPIVDTVWDVNPAVTDGGAYPFLHENGTLGGFAKELFGYNGNPSLIELIAYVGYFGFLALVWQLAIRRPMSPQPAA